MQQASQVIPELLEDRLVVTELVIELGADGVGRALPEQDVAGVARQQPPHDEHDEEYSKQHRDRNQ